MVARYVLIGALTGLLAPGCSTVRRYTLPGHGTMQGVGDFDGSQTHGIWVARNGFPVDQAEMDAVVEDTIQDWGRVLGVDQVREALRSRGDWNNYLAWQTFPFHHSDCPAAVAGPNTCYELTIRGRVALVGWREDLETTALRTAIGNLIWLRLVWRPSKDGSVERTLQEYTEAHGIRR